MTSALAAALRPALSADDLAIRSERPEDAAEALALIDRAFGPGRYAKVSERLREGNRLRADLSFCAFSGEAMVGVVRLWSVRVGDVAGAFLGPIAVELDVRGQGVGARLVAAASSAADLAGEPYTLLVGDPAFFNPLGFTAAAAAGVVMPGPVDPRRVMVRLGAGATAAPSGPARLPAATGSSR